MSFIVLLSCALYFIPKVSINENKADYLPKQSEAKQGLEIIEDEFTLEGNTKAKVLIKNKGIDDIIQIKKEINQIDGVATVIWIDDFVDLTQTPIEYVPEELKRNYFKTPYALLDITFNENTDSELSQSAIQSIHQLLNDEGGVGLTTRSAIDEFGYSTAIIAIIIIVVIILLFTDSFFKALVMIITLGVAIVFNFGSNILFEEISDISFMAAAVIQLAVSIDYSLIFMKYLNITRKQYDNVENAIAEANRISFKTILAGALTTIAGFLALGVMDYELGRELGFILAKGVLFSLLSVCLLLPALMKISIKLVDKTKHKPWLPSINWLSKIISGKVSILMLLLLLSLSIFGFYGQANNQYTYSDNQVEYTELEEEIVSIFGEFNEFILVVPNEKQKILDLVEEIKGLNNVKNITHLYSVVPVETLDSYIPEEIKQQFMSDDHSLIFITMDLEIESKETFESINQIRSLASQYYDKSYLTGESAVINDVKETVEDDYILVILVSIIAIALIIILIFKSITIPIILLLVIQTAIWLNMAIPYYQGISLAFLGYILISSIQLGATIDYAIIMTEQYNKERKMLKPKESAREAFKTSSQPILISMMSLVIAGFSLSLMMDMDLIKDLGILIGRGTIISGVLSLIVLPQLLILFDRILRRKV